MKPSILIIAALLISTISMASGLEPEQAPKDDTLRINGLKVFQSISQVYDSIEIDIWNGDSLELETRAVPNRYIYHSIVRNHDTISLYNTWEIYEESRSLDALFNSMFPIGTNKVGILTMNVTMGRTHYMCGGVETYEILLHVIGQDSHEEIYLGSEFACRANNTVHLAGQTINIDHEEGFDFEVIDGIAWEQFGEVLRFRVRLSGEVGSEMPSRDYLMRVGETACALVE